MKLLISQRAEADLAYIFAMIALERPSSAEAFKRAVEQNVELLSANPAIGPAIRFRTRHKRLRFCPITDFQNYIIYYSVGENEVSIERVLDGRRDVLRLLRSGN